MQLQPAPHVRTGHAGAAQGDALAVGLLQGAGELAGHGQQARLAIAQGAGFALQAGIGVFAADQGGEGFAGPVDQLEGAFEARLGLPQQGFRAAFDGVGELVVQARQLGVQVTDLAGVGQAQRLRAGNLGQQRGHLVILAHGARQRGQQGLHLLGDGRELVILVGGVPDQKAQVAQAFEGGFHGLGLEGIEQLVQVFTLQAALRQGRQLQEHPDAQARRCLAAGDQPAQRIQHVQPLAQAPGQRRFRGLRGVAEIALEGAGFMLVAKGGGVEFFCQFIVGVGQDCLETGLSAGP
ncbi:conserved hypothetical protein [Herbaspirillum seropedicae SmR1]|uniref:Uncharacterized protein n=1 Tax=Herbaspirillum seropedicae (strain SmR1) TaxID=757424 RepID=D8INZ4_HERSS|nr:conserved hypothetical protein [Herbaspirillum seropedicae SmR1]